MQMMEQAPGVCETCHTTTAVLQEHMALALAHETMEQYVQRVMTHLGGFAKPIDPADAPHNAGSVIAWMCLQDCTVCHDPGTYVDGRNNTKHQVS